MPLDHLDLSPLTEFEKTILCELRKSVARGSVTSYGKLAAKAGFPGAARAVGNTMKKNPFPLFFPCHRVIRSDGNPGKFQGGTAIKLILLDLEKSD